MSVLGYVITDRGNVGRRFVFRPDADFKQGNRLVRGTKKMQGREGFGDRSDIRGYVVQSWTTEPAEHMDMGDRRGLGNLAGTRSAIKPVEVMPHELAEFSELDASRHLERLEADQELVLQLALRGYIGPEWNAFAAALAEYGFQVITAWICSGIIFGKCNARGLGLGVAPEDLRSIDVARELAGETVALAIRAFREKVLMANRWDPKKGASLKTFFIGQCVFQFPNTFRRWVSEQDAMPIDAQTVGRELELRAVRRPTDVMADVARAIESIRPLPDDHPTRLRVLMEMGYTQREIAALLNTTEKAIEMKLYRSRSKRIRK